MGAQKKTIRVDNDENWIFKIQMRTYDTKGYNAVPVNLSTQFVIMEVYNVTGGIIVSANTDTSNEALSNALSGVAIVNFPLSSTINIPDALYDYSIFIADFPDRASATYVKKVCYGPFELT